MLGRHAPTTRFAGRSPGQARAILAMLAAAVGWGGFLGAGPAAEAASAGGRGLDAALYLAVVERVHAGEAYYDAAGHELRERSYATRPFWNWRLPTLAWVTGSLPRPELARWLVAGGAVAALLAWVALLRAELGLASAVVGGLLLGGPLLVSASDRGYLFHELWAGIAIAISLAAFGLGRRRLCVAAGLAALFVRELALPYVVVMAGAAWLERDRRAAAPWLAGLVSFAAVVALHAIIVSGRLGPSELTHDPWVRFGGWSFVLSTARWNPYLLGAPGWVVSLWLPLCLLGLAGWRSRAGARAAATVAIYAAAFMVAGRPDNDYWGLVYGPVASVGLLLAPAALLDLVRAASGRTPSHSAIRSR